MSVSNRHAILGFVAWMAICFAAAALGGLATASAPEFYAQLSRPAWAPPAWLFGPVWTLLYVLMGVSAWLVWKEQDAEDRRLALGLFLVQLGLNALWSWLFFTWRGGEPAFAEILLLLACLLLTVERFGRIRRLAAVLLVPYIAWVTFAAALTYEIVRRNPQLLG